MILGVNGKCYIKHDEAIVFSNLQKRTIDTNTYDVEYQFLTKHPVKV